MSKVENVIVTRHPALVQLLADNGITGTVVEHADANTVSGKHVYGVLPLHLLEHAASLTVVGLMLPPELSGKELSMDDVYAFFTGMRTYRAQGWDSVADMEDYDRNMAAYHKGRR